MARAHLIVIECHTAQVFYTSHLKVATDPDRTGMEQTAHEKTQTYSNVGNMYREEAKADSHGDITSRVLAQKHVDLQPSVV